MIMFYTQVRLLMCQTLSYILLVLAVGCQCKGCLIASVIVGKHLQYSIFLSNTFITVIDIVVKYSYGIYRWV